jgi:nitrate reductase beta subunit
MVEADKASATNHNKPELNKITMVELDKMFATLQTRPPRCWSMSVRKQEHYVGGWQYARNKLQQTKAPRCENIRIRKQDHDGGG